MKYEKQFRIAHPETVGETDHGFDLLNYAEWLDNEYSELLQQRDELNKALNQINELCSEGYEDTESIIDACLDLSFAAIKNR